MGEGKGEVGVGEVGWVGWGVGRLGVLGEKGGGRWPLAYSPQKDTTSTGLLLQQPGPTIASEAS